MVYLVLAGLPFGGLDSLVSLKPILFESHEYAQKWASQQRRRHPSVQFKIVLVDTRVGWIYDRMHVGEDIGDKSQCRQCYKVVPSKEITRWCTASCHSSGLSEVGCNECRDKWYAAGAVCSYCGY